MKNIYLIRHSAPFVEIANYEDFADVSWKEYNQNMILSKEGEDNAKKLCDIDELGNIDEVYSANSCRSIGTAKYIAELNNLNVKLDDRINERELGVEKISELPDDFTVDSFNDKDLKVGFGESLNEVDNRFNGFINDILKTDGNNIALFIHGIILMSYLQNNTNFEFDGENMKLEFNNKVVYNDTMKNPLVFKLVFDDNKLIDIVNIDR